MYLKNIRVIELASVLAAPSVGQFLAELGAEVIKIENPLTQGDVTRTWKLASENPDTTVSAYFSSVNWGKTSVCLNIQEKADAERLYQMIEQADIVLASYKPRDAEKLGVDYETLSKINPRIIYGHITGYGNDVGKAGYDAIIQAEAGFMFMNGEPDSPPTKMPVALVDVLAGHQLKEGILLALLGRMQTGEGAYVEVSLFDSAVAALVNQATNWLNAGHIPVRMGSEHPNIVPYGSVFTTKDQKLITLAVGTDKQFALLCNLLCVSESISKKFATNAQRVKGREELLPILKEKILLWDKNALLERLEELKIPAGGVHSMPEVFEMPFTKELMFTTQHLKGIRQWVGKINGRRGLELKEPPAFNMD
jgi:crotonobetainyl-CoA:carnitine CoA-transferase CaiB-like acyl-CoA transferase